MNLKEYLMQLKNIISGKSKNTKRKSYIPKPQTDIKNIDLSNEPETANSTKSIIKHLIYKIEFFSYKKLF